ncbi:MAG: Hsp20/alpha crystallin family protein [Candidatus Paceibacterota bacterium]
MDDETKIFFEKLTGANGNDEDSDAEENAEEKEIEMEIEKPTLKKTGRGAKKKTSEEPEKIAVFEEPKMLDEENSIDELFDESEGELAIDVYSTPTSLVIESAIAGVKPENIDVSINPESITIRGKRERIDKIKTENYIHQECYWGRFSRTIILPQEIDPDKSQASIKNGVLKITLPKRDKEKVKKIKIKFE